MGNSLVIVAISKSEGKDREETRIRAKDRGRFDRSNTHGSPSGLVFISPSQPRHPSLPRVPACRTCVRIRFHAIPFDRVPRINYFRTDPPSRLLVSRRADVLRRKKEDN